MNDDLISRKAAINAMRKLHADDVDTYGAEIPECFDDKKAINALETLPPVQPKTGSWLPIHGEPSVACGVCRKKYDWDTEAQYYNFCPNCGESVKGGK